MTNTKTTRAARPSSRLLPLLLAPLLLLASAAPSHAGRGGTPRSDDWFGPSAGDFELGLSGNLGHLFSSKFTAFNVGVAFGVFVADWFEIGAFAGLGYSKKAAASASTGTGGSTLTVPGLSDAGGDVVGSRRQALAIAPVSTSGGGVGWYGSTMAFARLFPFAIDKSDPLLPYWLGPFVGVQVGGIYGEDISPFFSVGASIGVNIYLTDQIALTPELGYNLIVSTDDAVKFDTSSIEHALVAAWGLSFFFS